jgi:hypothetical protein
MHSGLRQLEQLAWMIDSGNGSPIGALAADLGVAPNDPGESG